MRVSVVGQPSHARSGFSDAEAPFCCSSRRAAWPSVSISDSRRGRCAVSASLWGHKEEHSRIQKSGCKLPTAEAAGVSSAVSSSLSDQAMLGYEAAFL